MGTGLICLIVVLDHLVPPPVKSIPTGVIITDYQGRWLNAFPVRSGDRAGTWRFTADLDQIDESFLERLILIEDKRFWSHPGVDMVAIARACLSSLRAGRFVSGASTIPMQTARLLEPRERNLGSKFIEILRAVQLERRYSKREILSLYLTLAPYGGNIEGVRAASLLYFGKEPEYLTLSEQALLIAIPQAPEARRPDLRPTRRQLDLPKRPDLQGAFLPRVYMPRMIAPRAIAHQSQNARPAQGEIAKKYPLQNHGSGADRGRALILQKLARDGHISTQMQAEAHEAPIPTGRHPLTRIAWHETFAQSRAYAPRLWSDGSSVLALSLDADIQTRLERIIAQAFEKQGRMANFAALVIENETRSLRGSLGSASLSLDGGWLDMTSAVRSPGSTLKPFIYGFAFEAGYADENTLIEDVAQSFGGYSPENFTRIFNGDVTVTEALQYSLNIPAVLALDHIGAARFAGRLRATGITLNAPMRQEKAGLAIALGGVGMTARDLAQLYAALADDGVVRPIGTGAMSRQSAGYPLIGEAYRQKLTRIMQQGPSVTGRIPAQLTQDAPRIAFKTGTSYGFRDAWAVGYTDDFTVLIWTGHANGTPRPGETGRKAALPVLFEVFDALARHAPSSGSLMASSVTPVISGNTMQSLPGQSLPGRSLQKRSLPERWSPERSAYRDDHRAGIDAFETGGALSQFKTPRAFRPPEIIFPQDGVELFHHRSWHYDRNSFADMRSGAPDTVNPQGGDDGGYVLSARGGSGDYQWYAEGEKLPKHADGRVRWRPQTPGFYKISVVDSRGARSDARVFVRS